MTREEAINHLKTVAKSAIDSGYDSAVVDAINMAIKALEQEPCDVPVINVGDMISRQAALDAFGLSEKSRKYGGDHSGYDTIMLYEVQDVIEALPSVQPKQKTGHWEWVQYDYNPKLGNWHCSECRCVVVECVDKNEKGGIPLYKYCPQCGAKMVESEDKE